LEGGGESLGGLIDLRRRNAVGRHQDENISDIPREKTVLSRGFANPKADPFANRKSFPGGKILHQFNRTDHPFAADVADLGMLPKALCGRVQVDGESIAVGFRMGGLQQFKTGSRHGTPELISTVAVSVEERLELLILAKKGGVDLIAGQRRGQRHVTTRDPLPQRDDIGNDLLGLRREDRTRAAACSSSLRPGRAAR
jgi:hypothetical protein